MEHLSCGGSIRRAKPIQKYRPSAALQSIYYILLDVRKMEIKNSLWYLEFET
jgi:hypothetical protein